MKIYVAGASSELPRARGMMRAASKVVGLDVISTWPDDVEAAIRAGKRDCDFTVQVRIAELRRKDGGA